jgi:hypothetical protein
LVGYQRPDVRNADQKQGQTEDNNKLANRHVVTQRNVAYAFSGAKSTGNPSGYHPFPGNRIQTFGRTRLPQ